MENPVTGNNTPEETKNLFFDVFKEQTEKTISCIDIAEKPLLEKKKTRVKRGSLIWSKKGLLPACTTGSNHKWKDATCIKCGTKYERRVKQ